MIQLRPTFSIYEQTVTAAVAATANFDDQDIEIIAVELFKFFRAFYCEQKNPVVPYPILRDALGYALLVWPFFDHALNRREINR
jgi:hypothetical protein